ncbi:hypothetical protein DDA98_03360 [Clostridium perfringens]|uniref:hypothetical protein n=1 Tax=Clostridium perfringens TaxID=1502 RepID=UPI000D51D32B|nr:hypothetical protein [Clostridium perfringens]PVE17640.1 hypothetical protein DDA98_03360 [Clostridium perfringens]
MENYFAILVFITPGFIIRKINEAFISKNKLMSDLEKTIISLLYGIPVLIINLVVLRFYYKINTVSEIIFYMGNLDFIFKYLFITLISIFICNIAIILVNKISIKFINKIREFLDMPLISSNQTPWEDFFKCLGNKDYNMPVEIIKDGKILSRGFIKHWDLDGKSDKDIVLEYCDQFEEAKEYIKEVKNVYYDAKNNLLIKEYIFDIEGFKESKDIVNKSKNTKNIFVKIKEIIF